MELRSSVGRDAGRHGGRGEFNLPVDVNRVKQLFNLMSPRGRLIENGQIDVETIRKIERFQVDVVGLRNPDGFISPRGRTWDALLAASRDSRYAMLEERCVERPSYQKMRIAYETYRTDSAPCKGGAKNQCAVRMSVAMVRCGLSFRGFGEQQRVHRSRRSCRNSVAHVLGANELARYLRRLLGEPSRYSRAQSRDARQSIHGRQGILYFDNCFTRGHQTRKVGDHIDLWTGLQYFNEIIHVSAGGDASASTDLFENSDGGIWFWPLG